MRVISGHLGWVRAVTVEPGNKWFATGAGDRTIKVYQMYQVQSVKSKLTHLAIDLGYGIWHFEAFINWSHQYSTWLGSVSKTSIPILMW
jgi:WD40 repeat protein